MQMSRKHFWIYDVVLPAIGVGLVGAWLSDRFAESAMLWGDSVALGGFGAWFRHSEFRNFAWNYSEWFFSALPMAVWLFWRRMNRQTDLLTGKTTWDRPIYQLLRDFFLWVEDGGEVAALRRDYEARLAHQAEKIRQLDDEMNRVEDYHAQVDAQFRENPLL